jgi:hypothetical protein
MGKQRSAEEKQVKPTTRQYKNRKRKKGQQEEME